MNEVCGSCARPIAVVGGRWVHVTPSPIGGRPRPSFVTCRSGKTVAWPGESMLSETTQRHLYDLVNRRSVAAAAADTATSTAPLASGSLPPVRLTPSEPDAFPT